MHTAYGQICCAPRTRIDIIHNTIDISVLHMNNFISHQMKRHTIGQKRSEEKNLHTHTLVYDTVAHENADGKQTTIEECNHYLQRNSSVDCNSRPFGISGGARY